MGKSSLGGLAISLGFKGIKVSGALDQDSFESHLEKVVDSIIANSFWNKPHP
jgi:hypothetical protein